MAYKKHKSYNFKTGKDAWKKIKAKIKKLRSMKKYFKGEINEVERDVKDMGPCVLRVDIDWHISTRGTVNITITPNDGGNSVTVVDFKPSAEWAKAVKEYEDERQEDVDDLMGFISQIV